MTSYNYLIKPIIKDKQQWTHLLARTPSVHKNTSIYGGHECLEGTLISTRTINIIHTFPLVLCTILTGISRRLITLMVIGMKTIYQQFKHSSHTQAFYLEHSLYIAYPYFQSNLLKAQSPYTLGHWYRHTPNWFTYTPDIW